MLKNLFRVGWKKGNTDNICYMLMSLVSLSEQIVKKS